MDGKAICAATGDWPSGIFAPADAAAAMLLPTVESLLGPGLRFMSFATELSICTWVEVAPPPMASEPIFAVACRRFACDARQRETPWSTHS